MYIKCFKCLVSDSIIDTLFDNQNTRHLDLFYDIPRFWSPNPLIAKENNKLISKFEIFIRSLPFNLDRFKTSSSTPHSSLCVHILRDLKQSSFVKTPIHCDNMHCMMCRESQQNSFPYRQRLKYSVYNTTHVTSER